MKMIPEPTSVGLFSGWDKIVTAPGIESAPLHVSVCLADLKQLQSALEFQRWFFLIFPSTFVNTPVAWKSAQ